MKGTSYYQLALALLAILLIHSTAEANDRFKPPVVAVESAKTIDSVMTLKSIWQLVATNNPIFTSQAWQIKGAEALIEQAGVRPNPELGIDIEEFGWDAPGLKEPELSIAISQELELFGKRGARLQVAQIEKLMVEFEGALANFDLFLDTRLYYYKLAYAQQQAQLTDVSYDLASDIVATIQSRIDKGAALQSELLLASLEQQRAALDQAEASMEIEVAQIALTSMWDDNRFNVKAVIPDEPDFENIVSQINGSSSDSTREEIVLNQQYSKLRAESKLALAESKPNLTLSSGFKRVVADRSNSFLFGLSLPLPFRNSNSGTLKSITAEVEQTHHKRRQAKLSNRAAVSSGIARLNHLIQRHDTLEDKLLPTAEEAQRSTKELYLTGRLAYTSLLEANRSLVEIRFEHNDLLLSIREQIIGLERIAGLLYLSYEDTKND